MGKLGTTLAYPNCDLMHSDLTRLSRVIEREFGCSCLFVGNEAGELESEYWKLMLRNPRASRIYSGLNILIPLRIHRETLGCAVLLGGLNVRSGHLDKLEVILAEAFTKVYSGSPMNDSLKDLEQYVESFQIPENVIFISEVKNQRRQKLRGLGLNHESLMGRPVFLQCIQLDDFQRVAVDIHREMGSMGLVPWFALDESSLNSIESLKELGPVTIFVSEIEELKSEHQQLLETLISEGEHGYIPQFVFGSKSSMGELLERKSISPGLAKVLQSVN